MDDRWCTLCEAVRALTAALACTPAVAQREIKAQIAAKALPVKFAQQIEDHTKLSPDEDADADLEARRFERMNRQSSIDQIQHTKLILIEPGYAYCKRSYHSLMLLRPALNSIWSSRKCLTDSHLPDGSLDIRRSETHWTSLVNAVEHIEISDNCDSVEAIRRLKIEIADHTVQVAWARYSTKLPNLQILLTGPFWMTGRGSAVREYPAMELDSHVDNQDDHDSALEFAPLLVNSDDLKKLWPLQNETPDTPRARTRGRSSPRKDILRALATLKQQGRVTKNSPVKTLMTAVAQEVKVQIGDKGYSVSNFEKHIYEWLAHEKSRQD